MPCAPVRCAGPRRTKERGQGSGDRGGEARGEIVVAEEAIAERLQPVGEGRFVEAVVVVEVGDDVIAPLQHLARGLGKARLVTIDQRQGPRAGEVEKKAREKDEREFADTDIRRVLAIYRSCRTQVAD